MLPFYLLVGVTGFEPAASWSRTKRTTKLCHTPMNCIRFLKKLVKLVGCWTAKCRLRGQCFAHTKPYHTRAIFL